MLRLTPPGFERFLQSPQFTATWGGGEANVAVSLAQFGAKSRYITVLPQTNPIADAFVGELRRFGVGAEQIVRAPGRLGIYFVEAGANQRPSKVVYDREYSAISIAKPGAIDWKRALDGGDLVPHDRHHPGDQRGRGEPGSRSCEGGARVGRHCLGGFELPQEPLEVGQEAALK